MSTYNQNNTPLNNSGLQDRTTNLASTGISDTPHGQLNEPHTHSNVPTTQGATAERHHGDDLKYSGPPVPTNQVDQAGSNNPSSTNRTAATGIPPVNTAEHARQNAAQEALGGGIGAHHNLSGNNRHYTAVGGTGATDHHNKSTGLTGDHHHNATSLTGDNNRYDIGTTGTGTTGTGTTGTGTTGTGTTGTGTTGTGATGTGATGTGATGASGLASGHHRSTGLPGDSTHNPNKEHHLGGGSAALGDHGASQHNKHAGGVGLDERAARIGTDAPHPTGATATHNDGQRHAGVPQHAGLAHGAHKEHHATTGGHPTTTSNVEGKPSMGDKIKGNVEKMAGKITGNEAKVAKGENIATGHTTS
jgi:hypothetical protein